MKKTTAIIFIAVLFAALVGCQHSDEALPPVGTNIIVDSEFSTEDNTFENSVTESEPQTESQTEPQTEPQTEAQTEPRNEPQTEPETPSPNGGADNAPQYGFSYTPYGDVEEYLHELWTKKHQDGGDVGLNNQNDTVSTVVPVLKKSGYKLLKLETVNNHPYLKWLYIPTGEGLPNYGFDDALIVHVFSTPYYDEVKEKYGLIPNEFGALRWDPFWYFEMNGITVRVDLSMVEGVGSRSYPYEKISEYFDFEIVTYSPTAETGAVQ